MTDLPAEVESLQAEAGAMLEEDAVTTILH